LRVFDDHETPRRDALPGAPLYRELLRREFDHIRPIRLAPETALEFGEDEGAVRGSVRAIDLGV
jgi:hypothetical protein